MELILTDEHFMKAALAEAKSAFVKDEVPVGAVIVCNNKIIARSYNLSETLIDPTAHAEMQVITAATSFLGGKYLNDCTLFVTLEPCLMCAGALFWSQIGRLVYGASDEKRGFTLSPGKVLHAKTDILPGVLEKECAEQLRKFFVKKR